MPGERGALLRREGLYSSHLVEWRRARHTHVVPGVCHALLLERGHLGVRARHTHSFFRQRGWGEGPRPNRERTPRRCRSRTPRADLPQGRAARQRDPGAFRVPPHRAPALPGARRPQTGRRRCRDTSTVDGGERRALRRGLSLVDGRGASRWGCGAGGDGGLLWKTSGTRSGPTSRSVRSDSRRGHPPPFTRLRFAAPAPASALTELLRAASQVVGHELPTRHEPAKQEAHRLVANSDKAQIQLRWQPIRSDARPSLVTPGRRPLVLQP